MNRRTDDSKAESLHVHDLPQIYTRPSHSTLLHTLDLLTTPPPTLSLSTLKPSSHGLTPKVHSEGLTLYLTSIISSSLSWLPSDTEREEVWNIAAQRLTERAGRTATGALTRRFLVPLSNSVSGGLGEVELSLHEPSLTEDNLGLKTWGSSVVLASLLGGLTRHLPVLQKPSLSDQKIQIAPVKVLELGSGTGLVGLAAACVWPQSTLKLTDLPAIVDNLKENLQSNETVLRSVRNLENEEQGLGVEVDVLDWAASPSFRLKNHSHGDEELLSGRFDIILASDPLYSPLHPEWLVNTIGANVCSSKDRARVIVAYPLRQGYDEERANFEKLIDELGMFCLESGLADVTEDWGDHNDNNWTDQDGEEDQRMHQSVKWAIWAWRSEAA